MTTVRELREYGRRLGIRGIWRKNKAQLQEHLFNAVHEEVNERMLRRPNMDPERAYMEAELALRSKKLTTQKTWNRLREEARAADIPVNRRSTKATIEHELVKKQGDNLRGKYRRNRVKKDMFSTLREWPGVVARMELHEDGNRVKMFRITGNQNRVSTRLIMDKITPHIEMRVKVVYSFVADIYGPSGISGYAKTISANKHMFTSIEEVRAYIEECERRRLDLDDEEIWSKAYLPEDRETEDTGNFEGKVVFEHIQIKLIASNEPLIGCGPLPEWLGKKRCIYSVDKFDDNLCLWRCLAVHKNIQSGKPRVEEYVCMAALKLAREYYKETRLKKSEVRATKLVDMEGIAKQHKINIMVYEPKGKSKSVWQLVYGKRQYKAGLPTMNVGLFEGHCFYIKDMKVLCQKWKCSGCGQVFTDSRNLTKHLKENRCNGGKTKIICNGDKIKPKMSMSEKVFYGGSTRFSYAGCQWIEAESEKLGKHIHHAMCGHGGERVVPIVVKDVKGKANLVSIKVDGYEPETKTVYQFHGCKWHGCFCQKERTERERCLYEKTLYNDQLISNSGKYTLVKVWECEEPKKKKVFFEKEFVPYPHAIVFDFEARKKMVDKGSSKLEYLNRQLPTSVAVYDTLGEKPSYVVDPDPKSLVDSFFEVMEERREKIIEDVKKRYPRPSDFEMLPLKVQEKWIEWENQVPVYGFNSAKYDLPLIKVWLVASVSVNNKDVFVAEKEGNYIFISTPKFKFLDVRKYISPVFNLDKWLKSMDCSLSKLVFPHDWFDSYEKLDMSPKSIVWEDFRSFLDRGDDKEEPAKSRYKVFVEEFIDKRNCKTMHEVLKIYNEYDVVPMVEALKKTAALYYPDKIDIFKDEVSIPGVAAHYMINKGLRLNKDLELYAPGGGCDECQERRKLTKTCCGKCESCKVLKKEIKECKCDKTEVFRMLEKAKMGGLVQVFCRYHEAGVTRIRGGKFCAGVIGFDANMLYASCSGDSMPCGKDKLVKCEKPYDPEHVLEIMEKVKDGSLFGFFEVDIHVPDELKPYYSEFPPVIVRQEVPEENVPLQMRNYRDATGRKKSKEGTKKLVCVMEAEKELMGSAYLIWLLEKGLKVTAIHSMILYKEGKPFAYFPEEISNARREADKDPEKKLAGDTKKILGNSGVGKFIENKESHMSTVFTSDEEEVDKAIRSPYLADLTRINGAYEIKKHKREVNQDRAFQCGIQIYQTSKLHMLRFKYDFLDGFFDRSDYEYCYMDTDSAYIAVSNLDIDSLVKPEMKEAWKVEKSKWLATDKHSERSPWLFKPEFIGVRGIFLTNKCYIVQDASGKTKNSAKGVQQDMVFEVYKKELALYQSISSSQKLEDKDIAKVTNTGFRKQNHGVSAYRQDKLGLSAYYDKRYVLEDGIHTKPLW